MAWLTVASVGTILAAIGLFSAAAWSAALYYMANSTLVIAGLFLLSELVASQRGEWPTGWSRRAGRRSPRCSGLMLLLAAASVAGLPPLPGFIGKLMLLEASRGTPGWSAVWAVVLGVGFLTLIGLARAGSILFWNVRSGLPASARRARSPRLLVATWSLLGAQRRDDGVRRADQALHRCRRGAAAGPRRLCARGAGRAGRRARPTARDRYRVAPASAAMKPELLDTAAAGLVAAPCAVGAAGCRLAAAAAERGAAAADHRRGAGAGLPRLLHGFLGAGRRGRARRHRACGCVGIVLWDIVVSNLDGGAHRAAPRRGRGRPGCACRWS